MLTNFPYSKFLGVRPQSIVWFESATRLHLHFDDIRLLEEHIFNRTTDWQYVWFYQKSRICCFQPPGHPIFRVNLMRTKQLTDCSLIAKFRSS